MTTEEALYFLINLRRLYREMTTDDKGYFTLRMALTDKKYIDKGLIEVIKVLLKIPGE